MKRKLIDEKGRLFGVISLVDIFVVLVVVVLGCAVYMRFFTHTDTAPITEDDTFDFQLCLQSVRLLTADALRVGDDVYSGGVYVGTVTDLEVTPARREIQLLDGTSVIGDVENRFDIMLSIASKGLISNGRYYAGHSVEISVNERLSINTKYCSTSGVVWSIEK